MTPRNRITGILTSALLAVGALAAAPAQAITTVNYTTPSGTFELLTADDVTYAIVGWTVTGACPATLEIPGAYQNDDLIDPETGEYPVIDSFTSGAFQQKPCLSSGATAADVTGATHVVSIPETITRIPASAFRNDDNITAFDFVGEGATVPAVEAGAFSCSLPACAWTPTAYYDEANTTNTWHSGDTWSGMPVRVRPTYQLIGTGLAFDRRHVILMPVVTSNDAGTVAISAVAKVKVGRSWRTRTICSKTIAVSAGVPTPIRCTAGPGTRASVKLRKLRVSLTVAFTQTSTSRTVAGVKRITINRTR